jgi:hypothetical protein
MVGEIAAMKVLYDGRAAGDELGWVETALWVVVLGIVVGLVIRLIAPHGTATPLAISIGTLLVSFVYVAGLVAVNNL